MPGAVLSWARICSVGTSRLPWMMTSLTVTRPDGAGVWARAATPLHSRATSTPAQRAGGKKRSVACMGWSLWPRKTVARGRRVDSRRPIFCQVGFAGGRPPSRAIRRLGLAESGAMSKEGNRAHWERRPVMAGLSLLEVLAEVPDPRSRHGRVHPLPAVLALTVLAMLRGSRGPVAIAQFGRDYGTPLAHALGFTRGKTPAASCLSELFSRLDAVAFEAALSRWVRSRTPPAAAPRDGDKGQDKEPVSIDGK